MRIQPQLIGRVVGVDVKNLAAKAASVFENTAETGSIVDFPAIKKIIPTFFRKVSENSVAGPMLSMQSAKNLETLQSSGIKTIIDFRGEASKEYQQLCRQMGFRYFSFPLDLVNNFINSKIFTKHTENVRAKVSDEFVKNLKRFFREVDSGDAYMGCRYGVHRTNTGVLLNYLLNPKDYPAPVMMKIEGEQITNLTNQSLNAIKKILRRLSPEQRNELNIPDDFLSNLYLKKIAKLKEVNRIYYGN